MVGGLDGQRVGWRVMADGDGLGVGTLVGTWVGSGDGGCVGAGVG